MIATVLLGGVTLVAILIMAGIILVPIGVWIWKVTKDWEKDVKMVSEELDEVRSGVLHDRAENAVNDVKATEESLKEDAISEVEAALYDTITEFKELFGVLPRIIRADKDTIMTLSSEMKRGSRSFYSYELKGMWIEYGSQKIAIHRDKRVRGFKGIGSWDLRDGMMMLVNDICNIPRL